MVQVPAIDGFASGAAAFARGAMTDTDVDSASAPNAIIGAIRMESECCILCCSPDTLSQLVQR
jgi:hypothetical protein